MFKGLGLLDDTYTAEDIGAAREAFFKYFSDAIQNIKAPPPNE